MISNTGHLTGTDLLALRNVGEARLTFAHSTALALRSLNEEDFASIVHIPNVAGALAVATPALSSGEQVAVATYQTINDIFNSATSALAIFFTPSTTTS